MAGFAHEASCTSTSASSPDSRPCECRRSRLDMARVTSKGATCVTGRTKYSYFSKNCRLCSCICACRASARPISAPVSRSASRNLALDRVLHPLGTFAHERCVLRDSCRRSAGPERLVHAGEIGLRFLDDAAKFLEDTTVGIDDSPDLGSNGMPPRPRHQATRVPLNRARAVARNPAPSSGSTAGCEDRVRRSR